MKDPRDAALQEAYEALEVAVDEYEQEELPIAAAEVLGYTGAWLSKLSQYQLIVLQEQINAQLRWNVENG